MGIRIFFTKSIYISFFLIMLGNKTQAFKLNTKFCERRDTIPNTLKGFSDSLSDKTKGAMSNQTHKNHLKDSAKTQDTISYENQGNKDSKSGLPFSVRQGSNLPINRGSGDTLVKENIGVNNTDRLYFRADLVQAYAQFLKNYPKIKSAISPGRYRKLRPSWIIIMILIIGGILAILKFQFPMDLRSLYKSLLQDRLIRGDRELGFIKAPSLIMVLLIFCLSTALMSYFYFRDQRIESDFKGFLQFGIISLAILLYFSIKFVILLWIGSIFKVVKPIQSYLSLNYVLMANFSFILLPLLSIYALYKATLLPYLIVWVPFIFFIFFIFLFIRSLIYIISNYRLSYFYLFLYFCAFEICPMLVVIKIIYA